MAPTGQPEQTTSLQNKRNLTKAPSRGANPTTQRIDRERRVGKHSETIRQSRGVVKAACHECRRRRIKCDGNRPTCNSCKQIGVTAACDYATQNVAESRTAALKRENDTMKETLSLLGRAFEHIRDMSEEEALGLLSRARRTADPVAALAALGSMPPSGLVPATSNIVMAETGMQLELQAMYGAAYHPGKAVDEGKINATLAHSHLWSASRDWRALQNQKQQMKAHGRGSQSVRPEQNVQLQHLPVIQEPMSLPRYCDAHLEHLDISFWTQVPVSSSFAAGALSDWLECHQVFECFFDPELFLSDLVSKRMIHSSSLLVNAILYASCLGYAKADPQALALRAQFQAEAERLWHDTNGDSLPTLAACHILTLAYTWDSRDDMAGSFIAHGTAMASRMDIYCASEASQRTYRNLTPTAARAHAYAAWGVFCYYTIRSFYYRTDVPPHPPRCPIPGEDWMQPHPAPTYFGQAFAPWCKLHVIMLEVAQLYCLPSRDIRQTGLNIHLAERSYRELLEWSRTLPPVLTERRGTSYHMIVVAICLHTSIMDLFRPFLGQFPKLSSFSAVDSSPEAAFLASLGQLKRLIVLFRTKYPESLHCIQWHHANLYVANAVLRAPHIADWRFYFMLATQCYFDLAAYYPFTRAILSGLLSMVVERGLMRLQDARLIYKAAVAHGDHIPVLSGVLVVDQDRALNDIHASRVGVLAEDLTSKLVFEEFLDTDALDYGSGSASAYAP